MVSFQQSSDVHKKYKIQASTIYPLGDVHKKPLHQWEAHLLWKLMTKGERLYKDIKAKALGECTKIWKLKLSERLRKRSRGWTWTGQRGSNIEEKRWIKILGQEKHTSRGSKLMNFDWLHLICAYSCACLHCIIFLNLICMLVWCMLVVELEWWFDN